MDSKTCHFLCKKPHKNRQLLRQLLAALSFPMNIHPAKENDLDGVISWVNTEEECRAWAGPKVTFPIDKNKLIQEISFGQDSSYICQGENEILSFGQIIKMDNGYFHMARIITNPVCRGHGFGREICSALVSYAFELGGKGVSLNVFRNNSRALKLYESMGFSEQHKKSGVNTAHMVKT